MRRYANWLLTVALLGAACGSDDSTDAKSQPLGGAGMGGDESCPENIPPFVTGPAGFTVEDAQAAIKVRLDWAEYQPPANDFNTWKLAITTSAGEPLPQAQITWACAWMTKHGHGTNPKTIKRLPDGLVEIGKQNLAMNGGWDIRFWINATGTGQDYAGGSEQRSPNACKAPDSSQPNIEFKVCVPRERGGS
jgi:hypothetical protein